MVTLSTLGSFVQIALDNAFNCTSVLRACCSSMAAFQGPDLARPFKFPVSDWQLVAVLTPPALLTVIVGFLSLAADETGAAAIAFFVIAVILLVLHEALVKVQRQTRRDGDALNTRHGEYVIIRESQGAEPVRTVQREIL